MNKTHKLVLAALFVALTFIFTYFVKIPLPIGGYFNLGDAFIIISAILIDPFVGLLVGALAGTLSDLMGGYALYIPFTILAKGLEALIAGLLFNHLKGIFRYSGVILGPLVMVMIYAASYWIYLGFNAMLISSPFDLIQAGVAIGVSLATILVLERTQIIHRIRPRK